jgi:signal transduction histidine kinase
MAGTAALTREDLRRIDLLEDLDDAQLDRWLEVAEPQLIEEGTVLAQQGELAQRLFLLFEGAIMAQFVDGDRFEPMGRNEAPTWIGAIAVLTEGVVPVRMIAVTECRLATVPADAFTELALTQRSVHRRIMRQVGPVIGRLTAVEQNRERLASLGTMAAGLAHELNNPAAAATRAASDMAKALDVIASTIDRFVSSGVEREQAEQLVQLQQQAVAAACKLGPVGALDAADAEDELLEALEDLGVEAPWEVTEALSRAGVDAPWLARVQELAGPATGAALRWIAATVSARELAEEVRESTERISHLVKAVKAYAYMDRGGLVDVDLHEGLETTLTVLGHKLKHTTIQVERDYDRSLPHLSVYGSELNQVWTNLLDNAIDALGESGTITVRTRRDGPCVVVDIADDGPGIDPATAARIFEPFFTTKAVGSGTGLGLDTARRIVEDRHRGSLWVDSQPGETVFHVRLPFDETAA